VTRVNINSTGHQVEVDHDGADLSYVVEKAQKLWRETRPDEKGPGPAYGFSAEREHRRNGYAYMGEGEQPAVKP
jgi:hypothetical protein